LLDRQAVLQEIDEVLLQCGVTAELPLIPGGGSVPAMVVKRWDEPHTGPPSRDDGARRDTTMMVTLLLACIERTAPRDVYVKSAHAVALPTAGLAVSHAVAQRLVGVLQAVRLDVEAGRVRTLEDRVRDALSDDLLETASSIAKQNGSAAIVLAVSVLEEHVRKLAAARDIDTRKENGGHRSFEDMTADLLNADVLSSSEKRLMGGWYAQRTSAAHGRFDEVSDADAPGIIDGVRNAMVQRPA
jgi:hypothetical protein